VLLPPRTGGSPRDHLQPHSPVMAAWAWRLRESTARSSPPTTSRVGARTCPSRGAARSGRPPRLTTARTSPSSAAAHSAAAARCSHRSSPPGARPSPGAWSAARRWPRPGGPREAGCRKPPPGRHPLAATAGRTGGWPRGLLQDAGHRPVAGAVPATSAAVSEDHHPDNPDGHGERPRQADTTAVHLDCVHRGCLCRASRGGRCQQRLHLFVPV